MKSCKKKGDGDNEETTGLIMGSEELKKGTHDDGAKKEDDNEEEKGVEEEQEDKGNDGEEEDKEEDDADDDDKEDNEDVGNVEEIVSGNEGEDESSTSSAEVEADSVDDITMEQLKQGTKVNFKNNNDDPLTREHRHAFMHLAYESNKNGELKEHNKSKKFTEKRCKKRF